MFRIAAEENKVQKRNRKEKKMKRSDVMRKSINRTLKAAAMVVEIAATLEIKEK